MNTQTHYDKVYVLDTNIILNDAYNLITLSDAGKNLIILPEIVLDELDDKKNGFDEINFQARNFAGLLKSAKILQHKKTDILNITTVDVDGCIILMIAKDSYKADKENISSSIRNDRKILEVTHDVMSIYKDLTFISLDVMARTRAISLGINTEPLTLGKLDADIDIDFHYELNIPEFTTVSEIPYDLDEKYSSVEVTNSKGKKFYFFKTNNGWKEIGKDNHYRLPVPPINIRQKIMSELIMNENIVNIISGPAGTGKTILALGCAMKLIDLNREKYSKIYYIRRTVISGSKEDELGFLPGSLEEKMQGYNAPMEDSLRKVAQLKNRGATEDTILENIEKFKEKYKIEYLYAGHLRGSTLEDGSILICDEVQNWDITSIRTIFSRMGKNSIIVAMGSNNQIDSQYLTKNTNALTFLMDKCGKENSSDVSVQGVKLTNVMRSKLAEWADIELY